MLKGEWNENLSYLLNIQINYELQASYDYYNIHLYFIKDSVGLDKLGSYFKKMSDEEKTHADTLVNYLSKRGGIVELYDVTKPSFSIKNNNDILQAFEKSLEMEEKINKNLLDLHTSAENDPHFTDFLESEFLDEQVEAIYDLKKKLSLIKRIGNDNYGLWDFVNSLE
tara:strand:+ start:386 stop:889 length:504 start_codon:yes stop_codon:yes gene_type:complete